MMATMIQELIEEQAAVYGGCRERRRMKAGRQRIPVTGDSDAHFISFVCRLFVVHVYGLVPLRFQENCGRNDPEL
jgi:hypothetical protein